MQLDEALLCESAPRHCAFYKASDGKWYMELADREYYNEDDPEPGSRWGDGERESATTYGPFPTEDAAMDYLDNFSNPGGFHTDDSGKAPPPTKSPNGNPVVNPSSRSSYGGYDYAGGYRSSRYREPAYTPPPAPKPATPASKPAATPAKPAAAPSAQQKPPAKGGKKTSYKIYNGTGTGKAVTGSSPIHTRIKGKVYAPTGISKFRPGKTAAVEPDGEDLKVSDPDTGHTQKWTKRESFERLLRDFVKLVND